MAIEWYIKKGTQENGPLTSADIRKLVASGELQPMDLVRKAEMTKWARASAIRGLFPPADAPLAASTAGQSAAPSMQEPKNPLPEKTSRDKRRRLLQHQAK